MHTGNRTFKITGRQLIVGAAGAALAIGALGGCASAGAQEPAPSDTSGAGSETSATPVPSSSGFPVEFDASLSSSFSRIGQLGGGSDESTYGVATLDGRTTINKRSVSVKDILTADLKDGSGPIGGFLELKWSDGTVLAMRQSGGATYDATDKQTQYEAKLEVIGASQSAKGTTGTGTLTGVKAGKSGTTGGSIKIHVTLDLVNAPTDMTGNTKSQGAPGPTATYNATIAP